MSEQPALDMTFPATCAHCGGRISERVSFSPHRGARASFAPAEHGPYEGGGYRTAAARFEPPMRSFAPTDFEGDLDAPGGDAAVSTAPPPDGDSPRLPRGPVFPRAHQLGLKSGIALIVTVLLLLYGGVTAVHRYDQPSAAPVPQQEASGPALEAATPPATNAGAAQTHAREAGAAHSRHILRGRTHAHKRTHAHPKSWRTHFPDTTYMHSDIGPPRQFEQRGTHPALA